MMSCSWLRVWVCAALSGAALPVAAQTTVTQVAEFSIPEANQGVGVDKDYFYAVDNSTIAKYTKGGKLVTRQQYSDIGVQHLDSAVVVQARIYCAHSNYRYFPMTSSIEVFDADTLDHMGSHSLGIMLGSLTWLDLHDGAWWGTFANYDRTGRLPDGTSTDMPYGTKYNTTLVRFTKDWQIAEAWIFPVDLLDKFEDMSNSGGSWGPDGRLYVSGHDPAEIYKLRFPKAGSILEVEETIPVNIRGQGIAWDSSAPGVLYGIIRATDDEVAQGGSNKVVAFRTNVKKALPGWSTWSGRFKP